MSRLKLLVISSADETGEWLEGRLDSRAYGVSTVRPGPGLIAAVREARPDVAVLEGIDTRPRAAQMEVALLKDQCPGVQIIAMSGNSSEYDAGVVEQGIFFYLAGCSREELLRLVEAAAREWEKQVI
jgi:DNA-binding NtrC family response regulator